MKAIKLLLVLLVLPVSAAFPQLRSYEIHKRGMLHQTVYNTGELGRAYDNGGSGGAAGIPSMEWPPYSANNVDLTNNNAQYNSFGAGIYIAADQRGVRNTIQCGAVTTTNGNTTQVEGIYSFPISLQRIENYPVLADGTLNPSYNPDEAEEIIVSKWATPLGVTITRTSRAWSFPGYDSFIIYEYELENTGDHSTTGVADTLTEMIVAWGYGLGPSMFGYMRTYNRWSEADYRAKDMFGRFDWRRYMTYNHDRDGKPDPTHFAEWAPTAKYGGGLDSPQAVGIVPLYYDYDHLAVKGQTRASVGSPFYDSVWVFDAHNKFKQPYINRYENSNLYSTKIVSFLDDLGRKTGPFTMSPGRDDSLYFGSYWLGRARPSWTIHTRQPVSHVYGFGPYVLPPHEKMHFTIAEVVGYGAGVASDSVYEDLGGGYGGDVSEPEPGIHPVPSWYNVFSYPYVGGDGTIGSDYLSHYPLPDYIDTTDHVVSIRDVADRAIQMYTGWPLVKYDTSQYEPLSAPPHGVYEVPVPFPAPVIQVESDDRAHNRITWSNDVEQFHAPRLRAPLSYYEVLKALDPLGPWTRIDSVAKEDPRFFADGKYVAIDPSSRVGDSWYYSVRSVDSLGGKSGLYNNITSLVTQIGPTADLEHVVVVPNPLVVNSPWKNLGGTKDQIVFMRLPAKCTIRVYSYAGQLVATVPHEGQYTNEYFQVTRNNQVLASGVYYFVVETPEGKRTWGKFVIIR